MGKIGNHNRKRKSRMVSFVLISLLFLSGCGKPKNGAALFEWAKKQYGDCTLVSTRQTQEETIVVLHDTLGDFDYEVKSSMSKILIDGSDFGSLPGTSDTFFDSLKDKVISDAKEELDAVCNLEGVRYEYGEYESLINIFAENEDVGREAGLKCAEILKEQNKEQRLDSFCIYVVSNEYEDYYENESFGSVKLSDLSWRTPEDEEIEYYTEMARMQTDQKAVFLRSELKTFADTGADLDNVVKTLGSEYPTESASPVWFYYFKASDGREYYLCDFNYYNVEDGTFGWYTDY